MAAAAIRMAPALLKASSKIQSPIKSSLKSSPSSGKKPNLFNSKSLQKSNKSGNSLMNQMKDRMKNIDKSKIVNMLKTEKDDIVSDTKKIQEETFTTGNNNFQKEKKLLEVNKMIKTLLGGIFTIVPMVTYIIVLLILVLSLLNIVIFPVAVISDWFSDDILIKDTFKYKLLEYSSKNFNNESYFFISYIKYSIFFMLSCYIAIIVICMFTIIVWFIATLFTLTSSTFELDQADYKADDYINLPVIMGVVVSCTVYGFYLLFFQKYISNQLMEMKEDIDNVDQYIRDELRSGSGYIKKDFFKMFKEKSPGGVKNEGTEVGQVILKDLNEGNYEEAKCKTLFYVLYSVLYDNIPPQNKNKELVAYYFLKNPKQVDDENKSFEFNSEKRPMSFYSLFLERTGPGCLDHNAFEELDIFHLENKKVKELKRDVVKVVYEIDEMLTRKVNFENKSFVFGVFILMLFLIVVILVAMFNYFILNSSQHSTLHPIAKFVDMIYAEVLTFLSPSAGEWFKSINNKSTVVQNDTQKNSELNSKTTQNVDSKVIQSDPEPKDDSEEAPQKVSITKPEIKV